MKKIFNLPTLVIIGLLSIYYLAILTNLRSLLVFVSSGLPTVLFFGCMVILPMGIKGGIVFFNKNRYAIRIMTIFSLIVVFLFFVFIFTHADVHSLFSKIFKSSFFKSFHGLIFGLLAVMLIYLVFFLLVSNLELETFIENIRALPLISPVFCFGAPAFWKKSLLLFHLKDSDIFNLSLISFVSGGIFLIGLLVYFVGKNYRQPRVSSLVELPTPAETAVNTKELFYKYALGLIALGIAALLYVCTDLCYLVLTASH